MDVKISIITINYNNKDGLIKTIDSVINQSFKTFEWIVIDGDSTDGSKELIESYQNYMNYWVSEPDNGIYHAMNKGIDKAKGEYLLFLNSGDCLYDVDVLEKSAPYLTNADIYAGIELRGENVHNINISNQATNQQIINCFTRSFVPHQSSFIKKELFKRFGMYSECTSMCSDNLFFFKTLILNNATLEKLPHFISRYDANGMSSLHGEEYSIEFDKELNKHPRIIYLLDFHSKNFEIIEALRRNKFLFFIFRVINYITRKLKL